MTLPISPQFPMPEEKKRSRLWRILALAGILIVLFLLAKLTGWIFFYGLIAPNPSEEGPLIGLWDDEFLFELGVFLASVVVVGLILVARRITRRVAIAGRQRMGRWESLVEPKEWPKLEGELLASRLRIITTVAQIGGGTALLIGIWFTYQNLKATREGQITDRFIRAVDQLGATHKDDTPAREIRLGGIYGLRRIAQDSAEDYAPVRKILNDYVRLNAPWHDDADTQKPGQPQPPASAPGPVVHPEADIQAALDFLGNPIERFEKGTPTQVNLPDTDLRGGNLEDAHLENANLYGAHLEGADLRADLEDAYLGDAHLEGAHLEGADLSGADLANADLERADLRTAHLEGVDLSSVVGLTQRQIDSAAGDADTKLPAGTTRPESWKLLDSPAH